MKFSIIWFGQLVDLFGLHLMSFALMTWTYRNTGSVTEFMMIALCGQIPMTIVSPLAGVIVDKYDSRRLLIYSGITNLISAAALMSLFSFHIANTFSICIIVALAATFGALQWPAYQVAIPLLVPKDNLSRANAMNSMAWGVCMVLAPLAGGILLKISSIQTVVAVDVLACCLALITLLIVRFHSKPGPSNSATIPNVYATFLSDLQGGFQYLLQNTKLLSIQLAYAACYFVVSLAGWLLTPIVLSSNSAAALGTVISCGGIGVLLSGLVLSSLKIKNEIKLMSCFQICLAVQGAWLLIFSLMQPPTYIIAIGNLIFNLAFGIIYAAVPAMIQMSADSKVLGRLFGIQRMASIAVLSIASLIAGPLIDFYFNGLLVRESPLLNMGVTIFGTGIGKGIYLILFLLGMAAVVLSIASRKLYSPVEVVSESGAIALD